MNKQVAGDLGLSEITVKIYRGQVMQKMERARSPISCAWPSCLHCTNQLAEPPNVCIAFGRRPDGASWA